MRRLALAPCSPFSVSEELMRQGKDFDFAFAPALSTLSDVSTYRTGPGVEQRRISGSTKRGTKTIAIRTFLKPPLKV